MIPKVIHQIWLGPNDIPAEFVKFQSLWRELYNDYEHVLWDDSLLQQHGIISDKIKPLYDSIPVFSGKCDLARYEILNRFGGIYLDMDNEPLRRMEFLDDPTLRFFAGKQIPTEIANGLFGCEPETPILTSVLAEIVDHVKSSVNPDWNLRCHELTGPIFFTKICNRFCSDTGYLFLNPSGFYPYLPHEKARRHEDFKKTSPESYSVHHWAHSWKKT
jgi:mannosyltransferase OCH1-like enzyme